MVLIQRTQKPSETLDCCVDNLIALGKQPTSQDVEGVYWAVLGLLYNKEMYELTDVCLNALIPLQYVPIVCCLLTMDAEVQKQLVVVGH